MLELTASRDAIRLAVGEPGGRLSTVWWIKIGIKGDVYIGERELKNVLKASIHVDGGCHFAFHEDFASSLATESRHIGRWKRDPIAALGAPAAPFVIYIPESDLRPVPGPLADPDEIVFIPAPAPDHTVVIGICFTSLDSSSPPPKPQPRLLAWRDVPRIETRVLILYVEMTTEAAFLDQYRKGVPSKRAPGGRLRAWGMGQREGIGFFVDLAAD